MLPSCRVHAALLCSVKDEFSYSPSADTGGSPGPLYTARMLEKAMEKAGIINPRPVEPNTPVIAAGSSGLFRLMMRDRGTCRRGGETDN